MDQRSGDRLILWTNQNPRDHFVERILPNFEMLDAKIASALNTIAVLRSLVLFEGLLLSLFSSFFVVLPKR